MVGTWLGHFISQAVLCIHGKLCRIRGYIELVPPCNLVKEHKDEICVYILERERECETVAVLLAVCHIGSKDTVCCILSSGPISFP